MFLKCKACDFCVAVFFFGLLIFGGMCFLVGTSVAASEFSSRAQESSLTQRSDGDVPKAPSSQSAAMSSHAKTPTTPVIGEMRSVLACLSNY